MARDQKVKVRIQATDEASAEIKKVEGRFDKLKSAGSALRAHWLALTASGLGLVLAFKSIISASAAQEEALKKLSVASTRYGESGDAVAAAAAKQAAALQQISKFGDEAIITQQAILIQMGVTAEKLPLATQAAVDLAEALGISLESAARNVGKTMGGFAGELGELIPELKNLTTEQLKAGAGIDLLAQKFAGTAAATTSFSKSFAQLTNSFGDLLEALGDSVTQSENANTALGKLKTIIEGLIPLARRLGGVFEEVADGIWRMAAPLRVVYDLSAKLTTVWQDLSGSTDVVGVRMEALSRTASDAGVSIDELKQYIDKMIERNHELGKSTKTVKDAVTEESGSIDGLASALEVLDEKSTTTTASVDGLGTATTGLASDTTEAAQEITKLGPALASVGQQAVATAAQFDALAASAGRAAATAAAVSGGGTLVQGGTRVRLSGGGSRLTSEPGGSFFTPERRSVVMPDGRVVFV